MTHVCHLLDRSAGWAQRVSLQPLLARLSGADFDITTATLDPAGADRVGLPGRPIDAVFPQPAGRGGRLLQRGLRSVSRAMGDPTVARFIATRGFDLVHAWGVAAAWAVRAADRPLVIEIDDPVVATLSAKRIRLLARASGFAAVCASALVRRRLIEGGVDPAVCVVIRPGVDFALLRACDRARRRTELGLASEDFVAIVPEPVAPACNVEDIFWAVTMINDAFGGCRLILPDATLEQRRIVRQAANLPGSSPLVCPGQAIPFEQLLPIADALVIAPRGDVSTLPVAWAFAAGVAVIGTAVPAIAELVSHKVSGLLLAPGKSNRLVSPLMRALRDRAEQTHAREVARGQAYERFSLTRYVDEHRKLYENLRRGAAPAGGIGDVDTMKR